MDRIWIVSHERFRDNDKSYSILAAFETEIEAFDAMTQYGYDIRENEYSNITYSCMYGSTMFRIRENDLSYMITQEDILRVIPVEFKTNKL